jgi:hypothetical protein
MHSKKTGLCHKVVSGKGTILKKTEETEPNVLLGPLLETYFVMPDEENTFYRNAYFL